MTYEAMSNIVRDFGVAFPLPDLTGIHAGVDTSASADATVATINTGNGIMTNGSVEFNPASVNITMEDLMRAAASIPPRERGVHLSIPTFGIPVLGALGSSASFTNEPVTINTVRVPWTYVYDYQVQAQQQGQALSGFMNSVGGIDVSLVSGAQAQYGYGLSQMLGYQQQIVTGGMSSYLHGLYSQVLETAEERASRMAREDERAAKLMVAETRAEQLMFSLLTPEQVQQYIAHGYFETDVDDRVYRIKKGRAMNVELIVKGKPTIRYCAHPADFTPAPDAMIAQFLMLRTDERKFLATANKVLLAA